MTIHGDDVIRAIRKGLGVTPTCIFLQSPKSDGSGVDYANRDGVWSFTAVGRDWVRGFRITVESLSVEEALAQRGNEWP